MPNVSGLRYDRKDYDEGEKIIEWKLIGKEEKKKLIILEASRRRFV